MKAIDKYIELIRKPDIICKDKNNCTTDKYHCKTCLRNQANKYDDKFSLKKEGYKAKW